MLDGVVYVGDWNGRVYALSAASGATRWTFQTGDKVKDAIAYSGGRVYFGSYDHHVYAFNARTGNSYGRQRPSSAWAADGTFYSTPRGRLQPRLHRLDRRQGLLLRRHQREAALVARYGRVCSTPRRPSSSSASTQARSRATSTASTRPRATALEDRTNADLGLADRDQRRRLRLLAEGPHLRPRPAYGQAALVVPGAAPTRPSSPTAGGSTSSATARNLALAPRLRL